MGLDCVIQYKGNENRVAGALSMRGSDATLSHDISLLATTTVIPTWATSVITSYEDDDDKFLHILAVKAIDSNTLPDYSITNGIIRFKGRICVGKTTNLRKQILSTMHILRMEDTRAYKVLT